MSNPNTPDTRAVELTMVQIEAPKSSQGLYELPCGFLDETGKLHTEVVVREMTGAEEDLLASKQIPPLKKFGELLARCVTRIGTFTDRGVIPGIIKKLPVGDRVYLMFAIRRVTLGDDYAFLEKCPEEDCKKENLYHIDLSTLDIKKMPDPMKRIYDVKLPSGKTARYRISTGDDEERAAKLEKSDDALSKGILMRLEQLDGQPPTLDAVKSMPWKDRISLRNAWNKVEGGVDTEVEMQCPFCSHDFKRDVQVTQSFFFPSET